MSSDSCETTNGGVAIDCYVGVGSNLTDPIRQVTESFDALEQLTDISVTSVSSLYLSDPLGPAGQPKYVNAVIRLATPLPALQLLDSLQQVENEQGRVRTVRWGARTLDLDLLLYGEQIIQSERLTVPHPGIAARSFVLMPLLEIAPDIQIPGIGSALILSRQVSSLGIERLDTEDLVTK